jgi:excisionase family DNA binding protein
MVKAQITAAPAPTAGEEYISLGEVTRRLPISRGTALEWSKNGRLPAAIRLGHRWYFDRAAFEAAVARMVAESEEAARVR